MTVPLILADADSARDVLTFAGRAGAISSEGVRLQAADGVLVLTAAALAPQGLFDATPTVLAMRAVRADPQLRCDIVVDRLDPGDAPTELRLPDTGRSPAWAGVSPPRAQWSPVGELAASSLAERAQWGISAVARGAGIAAGEEAVRELRARIWGEPDEQLHDLPRGVAFAAQAFGFLGPAAQAGSAPGHGGERARVTRSGRWTRLTLARGYVLSRGPAATGLTAVRRTG